MLLSIETLIELLLMAADVKEDDTALHVLMAVKRMDESNDRWSVLESVADGLGVPLV